jgi:hypothetical protein
MVSDLVSDALGGVRNTMRVVRLTCTDARRVRPKYIRGYDRKHDGCVEDARTMRPYLSSGTPLVYLTDYLVYSYLVYLSTKEL